MLSAYLFDRRKGEKTEAWGDALDGLSENQLLWIDLVDPSDEEEQELRARLGLDEFDHSRLADPGVRAGILQGERQIRVTVVAAEDAGHDDARPETAAIECFVGENWIVTAHRAEVAVLDEFRERAEGTGEAGALDAPSFLAALLEWVVTSYLRTFEAIEAQLEEFDVGVLRSPLRDAEPEIGVLVEARRRIGGLRRSLAPHREAFAALAQSEFDPISSEESARRFGELVARVDNGLGAARDAKDAVVGSFDVLIARTDHRTNEIMKILTLASVLLLPGSLIAGVMGMNFKPSIFQHAVLFWVTAGLIVAIALATVAAARLRRWI